MPPSAITSTASVRTSRMLQKCAGSRMFASTMIMTPRRSMMSGTSARLLRAATAMNSYSHVSAVNQMGHPLLLASMPSGSNNTCRFFSSSGGAAAAVDDWSIYYRIEANNAARHDATQLTVSGPDIDGVLASMTVALAVRGCSLVELHAAKSIDTPHFHHVVHDDGSADDVPMIHDVFCVVERATGKPFGDDDLEPLAKSLLEALKTPMNLVGVGGIGLGDGGESSSPLPSLPPTPSPDEEQIKIVKSTEY